MTRTVHFVATATTVMALLFLSCWTRTAAAFAPFRPTRRHSSVVGSSSKPRLVHRPLFMSDVSSNNKDKDDENAKSSDWWKHQSNWLRLRPPSPPEDQLIMTGDIVALFVYSFLDHTLTQVCMDQTSAAVAEGSGTSPLLTLDSIQQQTAAVPVWFDTLHSTIVQKQQLLTLLEMPDVHYSPIIGTAGIASVVMTSCWLLSGYVSGAFLFRNTLECRTSKVLLVTFYTWLCTCGLLVALAALTNQYWFDGGALGGDMLAAASKALSIDSDVITVGGSTDALSKAISSLTKADADYIFDSLTVLITWRFLVSAMLGYGK